MDAERFDALSKRVATPTTRRATLGAMVASVLGLAGAPPVARAAPGQTCTMAFIAGVRLGPSINTMLATGATQPGQLQGKLSFTLDEDGKLEKASLTLPNNTSLPVVGQATGNSLQMRIKLDERTALVALGVGEADIADCKGAIDGTTAGPQIGDLGDWHARAQGLTGEPTATGGGKAGKGGKGAAAAGGSAANPQGGGGKKGGKQGGPQGGGQSGPQGGGGGRQGGATGPKGPTGGKAGSTGPTGGATGPASVTGPTGPAGTPPNCSKGQTACGNSCVDLQTDARNCGACGAKCRGNGSTCAKGACNFEQTVTCAPGLAKCNGKCVKLNNDDNNCGGCGNSCGGLDCVNSVCGGTCPADRPDDCGDCVNTRTDPNNCGGCFVACAAGQTCTNGVCGNNPGGVCPAGQTNCSGTCVKLNNDDNNCGACGNSCGGQDCGNSVCGGTRSGDWPGDCGDCVNNETDPNKCGSCF